MRASVRKPPGYAHHFRLAGARDLDAAFGRLVREAYAVGRQDPA